MTANVCTLNDGQQNDNDEEEEGDVEQDAVELIDVSSRVLQLVSNSTTSSHAHIHVEQIALPTERKQTLQMHEYSVEVLGLPFYFYRGFSLTN